MEKISISITLIAQDDILEYNLSGEYDKEKEIICYEEEDHTKMELYLKEQSMKRIRTDGTLVLPFIENKQTIGIITIENSRKLEIPIQTEFYRYDNQKLHLKYSLGEDSVIEYKISFEVIK